MHEIYTSEVADEVIELHLAVRFDALVVEISVEHDDGESKQKHSVSTTELTYYVRVAFSIAASKRLQTQINNDTETQRHK